jgi:positive regulator of sigma E activity
MKDRVAEKALVLKTEDGTARVRMVGGEACRKCGLAAMGLCKPGGTGMVYDVTNDAGAEAGDTVMLGLNSSLHARGYWLAYVLPLALLVLGSLAGWWLANLTGIDGLEVPLGVTSLGGGLFYSLRRLYALDKTGRMYVKSVVREVPEFEPEEAGSAEGYDYLRAYRQG